jgi:catechol 2,3-dioxygenase-like lactoylglutathione lyase family enzyme
MFSQLKPVATLPTADLANARSFYEDTLGLTVQREGTEGVYYAFSEGTVFVYESKYAGTNKATAASFEAPATAFDAEVAALREKGVAFQTFEMDGIEWNEGVASVGDSLKAVWFSDPDGNVRNVSTGEM